MSQVLLGQAGPLPIKKTVMWPSSEPCVMAVSGSGRSTSSNVMIAIKVVVGAQTYELQTAANISDTHFAFPTGFFEVKQDIGEVTIQIIASGDTVTDQNDYFTVALLY